MCSASRSQVVAVTVGGQRLALALEFVMRVIRAVAVTARPGSRLPVVGTIDMHGSIIPVVDLRHHLGLATRMLALSDRMVIVKSAAGSVALCVDAVEGVVTLGQTPLEAGRPPVDDVDLFLADVLDQLRQPVQEAAS